MVRAMSRSHTPPQTPQIPPGPGQSRRSGRLCRRFLRWLAIALAVVVGLVLLLLFFARPLFGPSLLRSAETALADHLGGEWRIERVSRLGLGGIALQGVEQIQAAGPGRVQHLRIDHLHVNLRIWRSLRNPYGMIDEVAVDGVRVLLDTDREWWLDPRSLPPPGATATEAAEPLVAQVAQSLEFLLDTAHRLSPQLRIQVSGAAELRGLFPGPLRGNWDMQWAQRGLHIRNLNLQGQVADGEVSQVRIQDLSWDMARGITALAVAEFQLFGPAALGRLQGEARLQSGQILFWSSIADGLAHGQIQGAIDARLRPQDLSDVTFRLGGQLHLALPSPGQGRLHLDVDGDGRLGDPRIHLHLALRAVAAGTVPPLDGDGVIVFDGAGLQLRELDLRSTQGEFHAQDVASLRFTDLENMEWEFVLRLPGQGTGNAQGDDIYGLRKLLVRGDMDGLIAANVELPQVPLALFAPLLPWLEAQPTLASLSLEMAERGAQFKASLTVDDLFRWDAQLPPLSLLLQVVGDQRGLRAQVTSDIDPELAALHATAEIHRPLRTTWKGLAALPTAPTVVQLRLENLDIAQVARLLPELDYSRGHVSGRLRLRGPLAKLQTTGSVRVRDADVRLGGNLPPLTRVNGRLTFDANEVRIEDLRGELGYAPVRIQGLYSLRDDIAHDLRVSAQQALLVEEEDLRLRADVDLRLSDLPPQPRLSGSIGITDLVYSPRGSWWELGLAQTGPSTGVSDPLLQLFAIDAEPWASMRLDVQIRDGSLDALASQRSSVWLFSNFGRVPLILSLRLRGTGAVPEPVGSISALRGEVLLPFTSYAIQFAEITFTPQDPFDPLITASLRTRIAGYDVRMEVSGRASDPRIAVSTTPPLPADQALLLATTGLTPGDSGDNQAAALAVALPFLARQLQEAIFGPPDPDAGPSILDRFRLVIDEERSESGVSSARLEFFLGRRFHLYAERDRFEAYNAGILWRRVIGDAEAENPLVAGPQGERVRALPIPWSVRAAEKGQHLVVGERRLLSASRRQRRNFDASGGDLMHAADAAAVMTRLMRARGYARAMVSIEPQRNAQGDLREVVFLARSGPRWVWGERRLEGAPSAHRRALQQLLQARLPSQEAFTQRALDDLASAMVDSLRLDGYAKARVIVRSGALADGGGEVSVIVQVEPGLRYRFGTPEFSGHEDLDPSLQRALQREAMLLAGEPWLRRSAIAARARVQALLLDDARHGAEVDLELTEPTADNGPALPLRMHLRPGPRVTLAEVEIEGLTRTSENYARRRFGLSPGQPLVQSEVDAATSRLRSTVPMRRLQVETSEVIPGNRENLRLHLRAEEAPSRFFELSAGYGSYEGLRGGMRYTDGNLFGYGRSWSTVIDGSQKHYQASTVVSDADILGGERILSLTLEGGFREEPSFDQRRLVILPEVQIPLSLRQSLRLGYRLQFSRTSNISAQLSNEDLSTNTLRRATLDLGWVYTTLDDGWLPTRGYRLEAGGAVADTFLGSSRSFVEARMRAATVLPLSRDGRWGLALQLAGISRKPIDGKGTLPIADRLFLGGANSVRSFGRDLLGPGDPGDPVGGLTSAFAQAELRVPITDAFRLAFFYDIGAISEEAWDIDWDGAVGEAVGIGLRYHLPVGPLRLDIGYNPGSQLAAKHRWAIHFAVGFTF